MWRLALLTTLGSLLCSCACLYLVCYDENAVPAPFSCGSVSVAQVYLKLVWADFLVSNLPMALRMGVGGRRVPGCGDRAFG